MTTTDQVRIARLILAEVRDYRDALARVSAELGRPISSDSLNALFRRAGLPCSTSFLGVPVARRAPANDRDTSPELVAAPLPARPSAPPSPPEDEEPEPDPDPIAEREESEEKARMKRTLARVVEELRVAKSRQAFLDEVGKYRAPPRLLPREHHGMREMTGVILASDWHVEEPVEPESVAFRNEYNLEIADRRIQRFFESIIWNVEHHRASGRIAIRDLVLWLGGDLMTGYIHPELVEMNALSPTETIRWLLPRLRDGIYTLLKRLDLAHLEIPCSFGNHGRTTDKPRISTGFANSYEWLMYWSLADEFRSEPRVHFEITNSPHQYVQVYDWTLHFHHGDDVKYMGGVGGLGIPLLKAVPMWDLIKRADIHNIGHHHQLRDYGRAVVNGSLIGYGPYSQRIRAEFEEPQQAMYFVDSKRGKCLNTPLWVEDAPERFAC